MTSSLNHKQRLLYCLFRVIIHNNLSSDDIEKLYEQYIHKL